MTFLETLVERGLVPENKIAEIKKSSMITMNHVKSTIETVNIPTKVTITTTREGLFGDSESETEYYTTTQK